MDTTTWLGMEKMTSIHDVCPTLMKIADDIIIQKDFCILSQMCLPKLLTFHLGSTSLQSPFMQPPKTMQGSLRCPWQKTQALSHFEQMLPFCDAASMKHSGNCFDLPDTGINVQHNSSRRDS